MKKCAYAHLAMSTFKILFYVSDALVIIIVILSYLYLF